MNAIPPILALRYLVVDDDRFTCDCIAKLLHRWGAEHVQTIDNGDEALEWLKSTPQLPDIIICDLNMPEMDGIEFMRLLAKQQFKGDIILITASEPLLNSFLSLVKANGLNVLGALPKPLQVDEIIPLITQIDVRRFYAN